MENNVTNTMGLKAIPLDAITVDQKYNPRVLADTEPEAELLEFGQRIAKHSESVFGTGFKQGVIKCIQAPVVIQQSEAVYRVIAGRRRIGGLKLAAAIAKEKNTKLPNPLVVVSVIDKDEIDTVGALHLAHAENQDRRENSVAERAVFGNTLVRTALQAEADATAEAKGLEKKPIPEKAIANFLGISEQTWNVNYLPIAQASAPVRKAIHNGIMSLQVFKVIAQQFKDNNQLTDAIAKALAVATIEKQAAKVEKDESKPAKKRGTPATSKSDGKKVQAELSTKEQMDVIRKTAEAAGVKVATDTKAAAALASGITIPVIQNTLKTLISETNGVTVQIDNYALVFKSLYAYIGGKKTEAQLMTDMTDALITPVDTEEGDQDN